MKVIMLSGGLGNQMFQYAFYLSCKARGIKCRIDISAYQLAQMHNGYELDRVFAIDEHTKKSSRLATFATRLIRRFQPSGLVYASPYYAFTEEAYTSKARFRIGDWIHVDYFKNIADEIRRIYTFQNIKEENREVARKMQAENSVSLHIRRGDYLKCPNYCVCTEDYYTKAIHLICEQVPNPVFYIFSNDSEWCHGFMKRFDVDYSIVENNQGTDSYQDMFLMTQCKHNIIANSTFSWWGAWLNSNEEKIVVSPKRWFRNSNDNANCEGWSLVMVKE